MSLLQTAVIAGSIVWGAVAITNAETTCETKERTEQHAKERYNEQIHDTQRPS
jgi:hypothetical protein